MTDFEWGVESSESIESNPVHQGSLGTCSHLLFLASKHLCAYAPPLNECKLHAKMPQGRLTLQKSEAGDLRTVGLEPNHNIPTEQSKHPNYCYWTVISLQGGRFHRTQHPTREGPKARNERQRLIRH